MKFKDIQQLLIYEGVIIISNEESLLGSFFNFLGEKDEAFQELRIAITEAYQEEIDKYPKEYKDFVWEFHLDK